MIFSSSLFLLLFLPAFLILYYLADKRYKNLVILVSSILFYAWGAPRFIFVILFTTFLDFHLVKWMDRSTSSRIRRLLLVLSVSMNLSLLFYFKYCNFFIDNFNRVFGAEHWHIAPLTSLVLPIGISFYTFETLTYVIDVYRRVHAPLKKFWDYQLYIILFPKLIAGPIVRYHEIADQISDRSANDTIDNRLTGFYRFVMGLGKKVLIANVVGKYADEILKLDPHNLSTLTAWMGILGYTFQIYFDFSGYSDMAIGIGKMIGFKFPENFDNPYTSGSITEFWRRWHMTLGSWMRNYLYIPLGGNKVPKYRLYFNLWFVFLASGFWHGASWNFILWGAYHGLFLVLERLFLLKVYARIGRIPGVIITFTLVVLGWVFFRMEHLSTAVAYFHTLFGFTHLPTMFFNKEFRYMLIVAACFSFFVLVPGFSKIQNYFYGSVQKPAGHILLTLLMLLLFTLSLSSITSADFNPFIYYRF